MCIPWRRKPQLADFFFEFATLTALAGEAFLRQESVLHRERFCLRRILFHNGLDERGIHAGETEGVVAIVEKGFPCYGTPFRDDLVADDFGVITNLQLRMIIHSQVEKMEEIMQVDFPVRFGVGRERQVFARLLAGHAGAESFFVDGTRVPLEDVHFVAGFGSSGNTEEHGLSFLGQGEVLEEEAKYPAGHGDGGEHGEEDAKAESEGEAADDGRADQEEDHAGNDRCEVAIQNGGPRSFEAGLNRCPEEFPFSEFLLDPLENEDISINRHADGDEGSRDAREGKDDVLAGEEEEGQFEENKEEEAVA